MSSETYFRIILALVAIGMAIFLVRKLVTGRSRTAGRAVDRQSDPRRYWGSVGMSAILITSLTIAALLPSNQYRFGIVFFGLLGGQLFEMLVSRVVDTPRGDIWTRADHPRAYWRWVAAHAAVVALILVLSILQLTQLIAA